MGCIVMKSMPRSKPATWPAAKRQHIRYCSSLSKSQLYPTQDILCSTHTSSRVCRVTRWKASCAIRTACQPVLEIGLRCGNLHKASQQCTLLLCRELSNSMLKFLPSTVILSRPVRACSSMLWPVPIFWTTSHSFSALLRNEGKKALQHTLLSL